MPALLGHITPSTVADTGWERIPDGVLFMILYGPTSKMDSIGIDYDPLKSINAWSLCSGRVLSLQLIWEFSHSISDERGVALLHISASTLYYIILSAELSLT